MILDLAKPLQVKLFNDIVDAILRNATISNGVIVQSEKNLNLVFKLNGIFQDYELSVLSAAKGVAKDVGAIDKQNFDYFKSLEVKRINRLIADKKEVETYTRAIIGLDGVGRIKYGGFLDEFVKDPTVRQRAKRIALANITGGNTVKSFESTMKDYLTGKNLKEGAAEHHFNTWLRDTHSQHDRLTQIQYAKRLNLVAFKYSGGIQDNSRHFCRDKTGHNERVGVGTKTYKFNNKNGIWLISETGSWEGELRRLDNIKKPGYDPMRDLGAWNCLHNINFLTIEEAIKLRPQLKEIL